MDATASRHTEIPGRRGFTLVELLVVMVVLGLLVALLVPAIAGAIRGARAAQVTAEINNLATALAQFKSNFSDYPPSRILLNEKGFYATTDTTSLTTIPPFNGIQTDISIGQLSQRTVRYMSKFFPRCLYLSTTVPPPTGVDINGDGDATDVIYLDGSECLTFFLGGMTSTPMVPGSTNPVGMNGFSRNPQNPFDRTSTSRMPSLYEFKGDRLVDIDGDGFPSYMDSLASGPQGRYYAYFSAYGTNSYDPNDCNVVTSGTNPDTVAVGLNDVFSRAFLVNFSVNSSGYNNCYASAANVCVSPAPNPYTSTTAVPPSGATQWQNPNTFQIISAGTDQIFGVAGQFAGNNATSRLPFPTSGTGNEVVGGVWLGGVCAGGSAIDGDRNTENDNLANFSPTRLNQ